MVSHRRHVEELPCQVGSQHQGGQPSSSSVGPLCGGLGLQVRASEEAGHCTTQQPSAQGHEGPREDRRRQRGLLVLEAATARRRLVGKQSVKPMVFKTTFRPLPIVEQAATEQQVFQSQIAVGPIADQPSTPHSIIAPAGLEPVQPVEQERKKRGLQNFPVLVQRLGNERRARTTLDDSDADIEEEDDDDLSPPPDY